MKTPSAIFLLFMLFSNIITNGINKKQEVVVPNESEPQTQTTASEVTQTTENISTEIYDSSEEEEDETSTTSEEDETSTTEYETESTDKLNHEYTDQEYADFYDYAFVPDDFLIPASDDMSKDDVQKACDVLDSFKQAMKEIQSESLNLIEAFNDHSQTYKKWESEAKNQEDLNNLVIKEYKILQTYLKQAKAIFSLMLGLNKRLSAYDKANCSTIPVTQSNSQNIAKAFDNGVNNSSKSTNQSAFDNSGISGLIQVIEDRLKDLQSPSYMNNLIQIRTGKKNINLRK
jgi:hypothetical protein